MHYTDTLARLQPYMDKVFLLPLRWEELILMEAQIGQPFPDYFRQYLLTFGFRQDLVFEFFNQEADFTEQYNYLPDEIKSGFIPIGASPAGGDTWLISLLNPTDQRIHPYFYDDDEIVPPDSTFHELIERNVSLFIEQYDRKPFNHAKRWHVQFAIPTTNESLIYSTLGAARTKDWVHTGVSSSNVYSYEAEILFAEQQLRLSRQEYKDWDSPTYYFNLEEPIEAMITNSVIKRIDSILTQHFSQYKLVDYGVFAL
jgi:hypothetical protein